VISLPFFWAMVLGTELSLRTLRALVLGSCALVPIAVILLAFDVVREFVVNTHLAISAFGDWLLHAGDMAALNVIPYLAPVLLAFLLHEGLRTLVFFGDAANTAASPAPAVRRGRSSKPVARKVSLGSE
jgi:hypothetical protein